MTEDLTFSWAAKPEDTAYLAFKREDTGPVQGPAWYVTESGQFVAVASFNDTGGAVWFPLKQVKGYAKAIGLEMREV